jgi:hypothetical protein
MRICKNCNKEIPSKVEINGKIMYLSNRKFCLICSPLKNNNTRSYIIKLNNNEAFCARCQKIKNKEEFYIRKSNKRPFSYCIKCQTKVKDLKLQEKLERIIEERNGSCADCGMSFPIPVYEFYSDSGIYHLSKAKNMSLQRIRDELKNYIMLCLNCSAIRKWEKDK